MINRGTLLFADLAHAPKEELTAGAQDVSANGVAALHHFYGLESGADIRVSVKENRYDTADMDYADRHFFTPFVSTTFSNHASLMTTTIGGAGNSTPRARGVSPQALVTSTSFANLLPEPASFYNSWNISVQNHSYGTIPQSYYGVEAGAYDAAAVEHPQTLFVFSSGNSGTASAAEGKYAGLPGWANLTGNMKGAKNVVTVGATDSFNRVVSLSSSGPAHDGRIKPEVVAFGEDGSSGAAAAVSGTAATLQAMYRSQTGSLPPSSLVKALLLFTADDLGAQGPDHRGGWGSLNAFEAAKAVQNGNYKVDSIQTGATRIININVPAGVQRFSIGLAWNDPAAPVNAPKALIHNLNAELLHPASGASWQPWILSVAAHADSLRAPARRGVDSLNNHEGISILNPVPGSYQLRITTNGSVAGHPSFSVAWRMDSVGAFRWMYPSGIDPLLAGKRTLLRWQTTRSGSGELQWEIGGLWQRIATLDSVERGAFEWMVPNTVWRGRLRLVTGAGFFHSDSIVIAPELRMGVGFDCFDSLLLYWNGIPSADGYALHALRGGRMVEVAHTADSFAILRPTGTRDSVFAVAPVVSGGLGQRSAALRYGAAGVGCYAAGFFLESFVADRAVFRLDLGTFYGVQGVRLQREQGGSFVTVYLASRPITTTLLLPHSAPARGRNRYRAEIVLNNGQAIHTEVVTVYGFPDVDVVLFPNPVRSGQSIYLATPYEGRMHVEIVDSRGAMVHRQDLKFTEQRLTLATLQPGLYFLRSRRDNGTVQTQKLLVQ